MRWWWLHWGQTFWFFSRSVLYSTASQLGHLIHRPSGTWRRSVGSVRLILGGRSFSNQDIESVLVGLLLTCGFAGAMSPNIPQACIRHSKKLSCAPAALPRPGAKRNYAPGFRGCIALNSSEPSVQRRTDFLQKVMGNGRHQRTRLVFNQLDDFAANHHGIGHL